MSYGKSIKNLFFIAYINIDLCIFLAGLLICDSNPSDALQKPDGANKQRKGKFEMLHWRQCAKT
jgi:hypothetical protein